MRMKKSLALVAGVAAVLLVASAVGSFAAGRGVTITGEGKCAKCALKEAKECENVIQVTKDDKTVSYWLVANDVGKEFRGKLSRESHTVRVSGTVNGMNR